MNFTTVTALHASVDWAIVTSVTVPFVSLTKWLIELKLAPLTNPNHDHLIRLYTVAVAMVVALLLFFSNPGIHSVSDALNVFVGCLGLGGGGALTAFGAYGIIRGGVPLSPP